ncbi:MAG: hypothetical protein V1664_01750 [Candidatus Uhrbacteria bacterium]
MKKPEVNPKKKIWFITLSSVTIVLVLVGWFFSFRDSWRAANLSFSFSKLTEVKQGVGEITSEFKEKTQEDAAVLEPVIDQATEALREKQKQEAAAKEVIAEVMKENLETGIEVPVVNNEVQPNQ